MEGILLLGRLLYSLIFILSGVGHFQNRKTMAGYARAKGLPSAELLVVASGVVELMGGSSILIGFQARWGACMLVLFLFPVTLTMHNFWTLKDPMQKASDRANFLKNIALLGAALTLIYFGSGPWSLTN